MINYFDINLSRNFVIELISIKLCGCRDLMIFGFTTTYEISAYHHSSFDFESKLSKLYLIHCVVKFVSDLIHYVVKFVSDLIHYVVKLVSDLIHFVVKFVSDLRQVDGFLRALVSSTNKTNPPQ